MPILKMSKTEIRSSFMAKGSGKSAWQVFFKKFGLTDLEQKTYLTRITSYRTVDFYFLQK